MRAVFPVPGTQKEGRVSKNSLPDSLLVIDGLNISNWNRDILQDMVKGRLAAANCTCSIWENFQQTMGNIAAWKRRLRDNQDLAMQVYRTDDILQAKQAGKVGIILGFQNVSAFEDHLDSIRLFKELGVGIVQMAYNTQNLVGSGCYESRDSGLSDFGRDVVQEMNAVGILCDLSHVGPTTSREVIETSQKPVCYSHCLPSGLKTHPRNKSDEELRFIAQHGGFIGVTMFSPFLKNGPNATVKDYLEAIEYVVNVVGEDCVGLGTDFTQGQNRDFFEWITHDKGTGRKLTEFGEVTNPRGLETIGRMPNVVEAMFEAGWSEKKIRKIMGENWIRVLKEVWGE